MGENRLARVVRKQNPTPAPDEEAVKSFIEAAADDPLIEASRPWLDVNSGGAREKSMLLKLTQREAVVLNWLSEQTRISRQALIRMYGVDTLEEAAEREWQRLHRQG
jgi:hypothetical protein